ncbi:hypothetical protein HYE67_003135 [Fusarium culmorum]|uniref:Uncharacterized protein n=1 Tax=Fusarium culmorum TaxID=5516 RepID=A0A2T4GN13_FUSCU|nr:hypothetical protein FCULG_00000247 [Fusarium culmorum]QPC60904.1 hypothetical protein HYE67_003135 [Fusarium culmorum]
MPTEEQLGQKRVEDDSQQPVMLQAWLNESGTIASATDVWTSERALNRTRPSTNDAKIQQNNDKDNYAAKAA